MMSIGRRETGGVDVSIAAELPARGELVQLYWAVGWTAYTADEERLVAAVAASTLVLTARAGDGRLVGMARVVSDRATIAYVQDILVVPELWRCGIGGALLDDVLRWSAGIRQIVLMTDAEPGQRAFYESRAFVETHDVTPEPLRAFFRHG
jgi:GNAT superfamily N-acetyltransferase